MRSADIGNESDVPLEVNLALCLPRDELTVPIVRHICTYAMGELAVAPQCVADITLALTEACTNVLDHSAGDEEYEVFISITQQRCSIRVKDRGAGFDYDDYDDRRNQTPNDAEHGRGISLIESLVDHVDFESEAEEGTIVHLYKDLEVDGDHPVTKRLAATD